MNRLVSVLLFICLTSFTCAVAGGSGQGASVHTLVIDPGHGGMDPGAIGPGGHHESDLALAVSLKFGEMVKQAFPDVKIIYTRTTDKFVSLADRADMANKAKADLFICIHLNSAGNHDAYGTSTYVLGLHRTDDNLEVAKRENAVIELEGDKDKNYEFDPNSPEGHIIMSMKQNAFLDQSILIASKIEDQLAELSKRKSRGVKQAGFWVLYKTAMPSLLAEIGFISNPTEEQYLASDDGQTNIATSIFKAFRAYKYEIEGTKDTTGTANQPIAAAKPDATQAMALPISTNPSVPKKEEKTWQPDTAAAVLAANNNPDAATPEARTENKPIDKATAMAADTIPAATPDKVAATQVSEPVAEKKPAPANDQNAAANDAPAPDNSVVMPSTQKTVTPKTKAHDATTTAPKPSPKNAIVPIKTPSGAAKDDIYFTVQLFAAKRKPANYADLVTTFGLIDREEISDGLVRYMAGEYPTFHEAKKAMDLAHSKGIKDAFIVGYLNKKRQDGRGTFLLGQRRP